MKKIYLLLLTVFSFAAIINAQSTANYAFTTSTTGSLAADLNANVVDMTTGTTTVSTSSVDQGVNGSAINIGFEFWLMGNKYTQFNVTTNGLVSLSSTGTSASGSTYVVSGGSVTTPVISAFAADLGTGTSGKTHYKVVGTAPNRCLVIEFNNMTLLWTSGYTNDGTYQVRLYESTGIIEFVYGNMSITSTSGASDATVAIGFATSTTTNNLAWITSSTNTNSVTGPFTDNPTYPTGALANLNSAANGSRRTYQYTPPVPAVPTTFSFTSVGASGMTLNWVDNSTTEYNFVVLRSTDNINFTQVATVASTTGAGTGTAYSSPQAGLTPSTTYYWRVQAISEGGVSAVLAGSQSTTACTGIAGGTYSVGPTGTYTTLTAALAAASGGSTGPVIFELQSAYTSAGETFPITLASSACPVTGGITIRPEASVASTLTITSANTTATIDFNTGSNITIDGRPGGVGTSQFLTIANTSTATGGRAIRFINESSNNTIKYCVLKALFPSTTSGVVVFSTTTGANGNDNNTIDNCNIDGGAGGTASPTLTATNGIFSAGSTTTAATNNSGNKVTNCNIFDFFTAGSSSSGINIASGNDNWTISNNRIYQTATRTFTGTVLRYGGITVASSSGSFTVSGNIIGFANAAGTGTTIITGSTNEVRGIDMPSTSTAVASSIQGNTVSGITQTSARNSTTNSLSCFIGISYGATGGLFTVGNVTGNTIGSLDGSSGIIVNATSTTANTASVMGMLDFSFTNSTISNNKIGSITINSGGTGTTVGFRGILVSGTTGQSVVISNNTIGGTAAGSITDNISGSYAMYMINTVGGPNLTATGNLIRNISGNANAASVVMGGIIVQTAATGASTISQNTVHSLSNTVTGGAAGAIYAIDLTFGATANIVERNTVHSINVTSTLAAYQLFGIVMRGSGTATFRNNMIRLGFDASGASITTGFSFVGIRDIAGATANYYHNSVYIGGTGVVSVSNTYAFLSDVVTNVRKFQNNIFSNARSNASGGIANIAIRVGGTTANPAGLTSDYNDLLATGTDGNIGVFNAAVIPTIAAWRTATGMDGASINSDPQFIAPAGTAVTGDLHIHATNPTPIEGAGVDVGVTDDYDGQTRSGLTPTDIGADAGNFVILDISAPGISYTPLTAFCGAGSRTLTAIITDGSGVPTSGPGLPVLYWKINAGAYTASTATYLGSNQYQFTLGAGSVANDVISYYIVAQDNAGTPNIIASPSGGAAGYSINPPAASTPPTTPNSYTNLPTLSGTYTVGVGGNYTTLTAAIADYNTKCLTGPVVFSLTDATYAGETFPLAINANALASATNTLTIKPATGVSPVISGSNATAIISLAGSQYIIVDGSNTAGGTSQDLTIANTNTSGPTIRFINGASNDVVKNTVITGVNTSTTSGVVLFSTSTAAAGNNNNLVSNNSITKGTTLPGYTIYNSGSSGKANTNNTISKNKISDFSAAGLFDAGNSNGLSIIGNEIFGTVTQTTTSSVFGIRFQTTTIVSPNVIGNNIHDLKSTSTTAATLVAGIHVYDIGAGTLTIANNFVNLSGNGVDAPLSLYGILDEGDVSENVNTYHNTVLISGACTSTSSSVAYQKDYSNASIAKDNIFINTRLSSGTGKQYAIYKYNINAPTGGGFTSDYNDLYSSGNALNILGAYGTGTTATDQATFALWKTASGQDANSINISPNFISASNLHLDPATSCAFDGKGTPIAGVLNDIDGDVRNVTTPDIGADEFTSTFLLIVTNPAAVCAPGSVDITAPGVTAGSSAGITLTYWADAAATTAIPAGNGTPAAITVGGTYYIKAVNGSCSDIKPVVVTLTTPASATINYAGSPYCSNAGTATVTQTGTTSGTYTAPAGVSINASTGAINLGASTPGTYTITYGFPASGGCPAANFTTSVTITAAPNATIAYTGSPYCNVGTAAPTLTGSPSGGTYSSTAGLFINASTGQINLLASTPATYTVTYTVAAAGGCAIYTTTTSIVINPCAPPVITVTATAGNTGPVGYTTLKLAFDAINDGTHQGAVTVNVNGSTNEGTTPAVLNGSVLPANYTSVLVRPTIDGVSISGGTIPATRGVIELNGADNVTIDGDNPNSVGTNRDLTVTLTGTTTNSTLIWIKSASAADGATNNVIKNCIIAGQNQANTTIGILEGSSTFGGAAAAANSNITINNNAFLRTQNGIYWNGFATGPNYDANLVISNNNFGSTVAADKHIFRGMILQSVSNFTISGNTIQGVASTTTSTANMSGIQLFGAANGGNIFNNKISDIKQNNNTGYGAEGINLGFTSAASGVNVYNNFISDVAGRGWLGTSTPTNGFSPSDNGYGIAITDGGGYNLYYNTVHMNTNQAVNANPAALLINTLTTPAANSFNIRNNIFTNSQTTGTNRFSVISVPANTAFTDINYNDYFTTGPNLGNYGGTNRANLAAVQTATGKDANSVSVVPAFVSGTDLHLSTTGNCALDGTATPIATYTTDIDGNTRNVTTPDMGADEFASAPRTATIAYTATPYCVSGGTATVTQTGTTGGTYTAPAAVTINAATGAITLGTSTPGTYTITYTVAALGGCPVVTATTSITINAAPSATISYAGSPYCQNAGTANVTQTGSTGGAYSSTTGLTINASTGAVTLGTSTPGTYTVTYTIAAANGCAVYTTTTTITITAPPTATISYAGSPYCQNAGVANVTQTGSTGGVYSSTAGLIINTSTGAVTLGTSTPGTYTVTYTVAAAGGCAAFSTTASITITATPNATISYTGSPYCQNAGTANVTRTGTAGGSYSSTTGLTINASTGAVTLGTSTPGTYTVTYTVAAAGGCAVYTTTTSITITTPPSATISYAGSPYCGTGTATVTRTGTAGGTYSSTAGISLNASTGDVNLTTSTPGTYTVTYTVAAAGGCAVYTTTTSITINTTSVAPTGATTSVSVNCGPANGVVLSVTGGSLGTGGSWKWYTGSCGGTAVGTGATLTLNVGATTTYYVRAEGTCNTTTCASVTVTINPQPTISLAASPYTSLMPGWTTTLTATIAPVVAGNTIIWYRDGAVVSGATGNTINVTVDELGSYTARVTSPFGCTALSAALLIKDSVTDKLFISPNPNSGRFKIRYYTSAHNFGFLRTVLIYDGKGAIVYNKRLPITATYSSMDINMTNAPKGIYMVVLADYQGKPMAQGKVVIQ
jgi:hypothetical protein